MLKLFSLSNNSTFLLLTTNVFACKSIQNKDTNDLLLALNATIPDHKFHERAADGYVIFEGKHSHRPVYFYSIFFPFPLSDFSLPYFSTKSCPNGDKN